MWKETSLQKKKPHIKKREKKKEGVVGVGAANREVMCQCVCDTLPYPLAVVS